MSITGVSGAVLSDSFSVRVKNCLSSLELSGTYKTFFLQGEAFESDGLQVNAVYADGTRVDVSDTAAVSGYEPEVLGEQTVTVSYTDAGRSAQATYKVTVETVKQRSDVTNDGFIDVADITAILSTANFGKPTGEAQIAAADTNRDGVIDIFDISYVLQQDLYGKAV